VKSRHAVLQGFVIFTLSSLALLSAAPAQGESAPPDSYFQRVVLDASVNAPMELAVASDGRVFFLDRTGTVGLYRPASGTTITAGFISVDTTGNHGLIGLALDPDFAGNHFLYLFYSPMSPSVTRLSRFKVVGDVLDLGSEKIMLQVPTQRICCHEGGSIAFGPDGSLFVSTGDNTDPFQSEGYAPIDERPGREMFDAQRSAGNSQDLRGKILRITPLADGTYAVPAGNLFTNPAVGRPEIFAMGLRNPFRITVDSATGWLFWGDVGPDASTDSATRGPRGYDEINLAKTAGYYGWPYCIANNKAYSDFNFVTSSSGAAFNCNALTNNSPNNTGTKTLPGARGAWLSYPYGRSPEFPSLGSESRTAMSGPVYHFDSRVANTAKLPSYYDGRLFIFDWSRNWIQSVKMDSSGNIQQIEPFLSSFLFSSPIDMEIGPDGALYVLEWGAGEAHDSGADAKLSRIEFKGAGGAKPVPVIKAAPDNGSVPLTVSFSGASSVDPEGGGLAYAWDFTADGTTDSTAMNPTFTYRTAGNLNAKLTVTDPEGKQGVVSIPIAAGNTKPVVSVTEPADGGFIGWNEGVKFTAAVSDKEDGSTLSGISCSNLQIVRGLGHDNHSHTIPPTHGCTGTVPVPPLPLDHADGDVYYAIEGTYTDRGAGIVAPLTGSRQIILRPKRTQAEVFENMSGVTRQGTADAGDGGEDVSSIDNGDFLSFTPMNFKNTSSVTYRTAGTADRTIEIRLDSKTGPLVASTSVTASGTLATYKNTTTTFTAPTGTHEVFFVFKGQGSGSFNLNWLQFGGAGVSTPLSYGFPTLAGATYEAELAVNSGAPMLSTNAGFTGTGYGDYDGAVASGSFIEWTVRTPAAGTYPLEFRYANAGSNRPLKITSGTTVIAPTLAFPPTGSWTNWSTARVKATLPAGSSKIRATAIGSSGPNIDSLSLPSYQAEYQTKSGVTVETTNPGFTDMAYANYTSAAGAYLEFTILAPTAGTYPLEIRYSNGSGVNRPLKIQVGGTVLNSSMAFPPTASWSTWTTRTIDANLAAGANKVRATAIGVDGPNIDTLIRH